VLTSEPAPEAGGGVATEAGDGVGAGSGGGVEPEGGSSESADAGSTGSGSAPVVKSYPQFSQNSAPAGAGNPQCGHSAGPEVLLAAGVGPLAGDAAGDDAAPIGSPHTSQ